MSDEHEMTLEAMVADLHDELAEFDHGDMLARPPLANLGKLTDIARWLTRQLNLYGCDQADVIEAAALSVLRKLVDVNIPSIPDPIEAFIDEWTLAAGTELITRIRRRLCPT
jgi:hypothetical protein